MTAENENTVIRDAVLWCLRRGTTPIVSCLVLTVVGTSFSSEILAQARDVIVLEEVVVTGTQIRGVKPVGSEVVSIGEEDMQKLGVTNTSDVLRTIPAVVALGADSTRLTSNQRGQSNTSFGTGINLRGINTADTLILINGRRVAPSSIAAMFTDPNIIPQIAISRMDVAADGASAVYGSDAVAGVVNVQIRKPFDGAEIRARYGGYSAGKGYDLGAIMGKTWDSGGFMFALQRNHHDRIKASDVSNVFTDNYAPFGGPGIALTNAAPGTIRVGNVLYPLPPSVTATNFADAGLTPGVAHRQSYYAGDVDAYPDLTRNGGVFNFEQNIFDDKVKLFADGFLTKQQFDQTHTAGSDGVSAINVPATNPFYITDVPGVAAGAPLNVLYSGLVDFGPTRNAGFEKHWAGTLGAVITLGHGWRIEPSFTASQQNNTRTRSGLVNSCAFNGALNGFTATGQPCSGISALADSNPATAFNPFIPGTTNPETIARIAGQVTDAVKFIRRDFSLRADGELFDLPSGTVRMAVGGEYLQDWMNHIQTRNDGTFTINNTVYRRTGDDYSRDVTSGYAEFYVPLVGKDNAISFVKNLVFSAAVRHTDYSDVGSSTNPKYGLNWTPVDDLDLHVSYGTSFRAPAPSEISAGIVGTSQITVSSTANNPAVTGLPGTSALAVQQTGGNATLKPERAKNWSFGANFNPSWLSGLSLMLNYFDLKLEDQISSINVGSALSNASTLPYVTINPTPEQLAPLCTAPTFISTNCTGVVAIIDGRQKNLGAVETNGLDFSANYKWETGLGTWNVGALGSYVIHFKQALLPGSPLVERINTVNFPIKLTARGILGWEKNGFTATGYINYQNSYVNQLVTPEENVKSYISVDMALNYDTGDKPKSGFAKNIVTTLRVNNLFDKEPPYVRYVGAATIPWFAFDPNNANGFGRSIYLQIGKKF